MVFVVRRVAAFRQAARDAVARGALAVGQRASKAAERVQPALTPLLKSALLRVSPSRAVTEAGAVRIVLEQYFRAIVHSSEPAEVSQARPSATVARARPAIPPGVLHLTRSVERRLGQIKRSTAFAKTDDPVEAVHQLRVASRRLSAFVDMFEAFVEAELVAASRRSLRQLTRTVRKLRDADVQLLRLENGLRQASSEPERVAYNHLLDWVRAKRKREAKRTKQRLETFDLAPLAGALRQMLDQLALRATSPSTDYELLAELAFEPVLKHVRNTLPKPSAMGESEPWHRFRLALKRLRYAAELVEPALGQRYQEIHGQAKRLQGLLGEQQDAVVFARLVQQRHEKALREQRATLALGLATVRTEANRERQRLNQRCAELCDGLSGPKLFEERTRIAEQD
jgi:CHAD domain-containing protein